MFQAVPKHILRLMLLLAAFLLLAYGAKTYLTDPSYYRFGYYRADAVPQLTEGPLRYLGSASCLECHEERSEVWPVAAHKTVQCEVCHGTTEECPVKEGSRIPADTVSLCLTCHQKMPGRPEGHPQIVAEEHPVADGQLMACSECHDPHAPGPVLRPEEAALAGAAPVPAAAAKCTKCHGQQGEGIRDNPPLAGLEAAVFVERMTAYRAGSGESRIMIRFAQSLSEAEITELAAYYQGLAPEETPSAQPQAPQPEGTEQ